MRPEQLSYNDYQDSLIVCADVLGMSRKVQLIDNRESFETVGLILGILREQANHWRSLDGVFQELEATVISDSLIVSMPWRSEVAATALIYAMHEFQSDFLHTGHILRGYMARGQLYHKDEFLFGEGYIRAWKGEQGLKNGPPRIVLDPELVEYAHSIGADEPKDGYVSAFEALRYDAYDGAWFIDYLKPLKRRNGAQIAQSREDRERIRLWIATQQKAHAQEHRVKAKYVWLEHYETTTRADFERLLALNLERASATEKET